MRRLPYALFLVLLSIPFSISIAQTQGHPRVVLGRPFVALNGPWKFHPGDDIRWASPEFDDSSWTAMDLKPVAPDIANGGSGYVPGWTARGFPGLSGYAWYRLRVDVENDDDDRDGRPALALEMPRASDGAYQLWVNGKIVGQLGDFSSKLPKVYSPHSGAFALPDGIHDGTLTIAVRMWMDPSTSLTSAGAGGLHEPPLLGQAAVINTMYSLGSVTHERAELTVFLEAAFQLLAVFVFFGLYRLDRTEPAYLWLGIVCLFSLLFVTLVLVGAFTTWLGAMAVSFAESVILHPVQLGFWVLFWSHWFRLAAARPVIWLHRIVWGLVFLVMVGTAMQQAPLLGRAVSAKSLIWIFPLTATVQGILVAVLLWVIYQGFRRMRAGRWIAIPAVILIAASLYGDQLPFLHIPGSFTFHGIRIPFPQLNQFVWLLVIGVILAVRFLHTQRQKQQLELEFEQARQLQQMLVPEATSIIPGYAIESEYRPAQQVGGDFFQIIPIVRESRQDDGVLIIVGDVSGKGLKAAMTVSLIVGTVRTLAEYEDDPARLLAGLNRRLCAQSTEGFATCIVLRMTRHGQGRLANAGHLAPYLNGCELAVAGSLPAGVVEGAEYENQDFLLAPGDRLTLYTDGVLEARNTQGELLGFDRLHALLRTSPSSSAVADAACSFGQDDDITVLTMERLANQLS